MRRTKHYQYRLEKYTTREMRDQSEERSNKDKIDTRLRDPEIPHNDVGRKRGEDRETAKQKSHIVEGQALQHDKRDATDLPSPPCHCQEPQQTRNNSGNNSGKKAQKSNANKRSICPPRSPDPAASMIPIRQPTSSPLAPATQV